MNNINPLHIGGLLIVILIASLLKLNGVKSELDEVKQNYKETEKLAVEVSSIKKVYADKKKTRQAIDRILKQPTLKSADLKIKRSKESVKISSKSIKSYTLDSLMGKVLNGPYNITELKIKKIDKDTASLQMEIKW